MLAPAPIRAEGWCCAAQNEYAWSPGTEIATPQRMVAVQNPLTD